MTRSDDARDHLAIVHDFMDGKIRKEKRRITRDLAARVSPIHFTSAISSVLPHIAKASESGNHAVGLVFTRGAIILTASSGWTSIAVRTPAATANSRVTGDVVADSVMMSPLMIKQLMGFAGLTPKDAWDPQLEIIVTGSGPENLRLRATDRTGLFAGKSLKLPVMEPTKEMAQTMQILESMSVKETMPARSHDIIGDRMAAFVTSAKPWGGEFDIEMITPAMWRLRCAGVWYGLITAELPTEDNRIAISADRTKQRHRWQERLAGLGQELVREFE